MKDHPTIGFIGQGYIGKNYADDFVRRGYSVVRYALEEPYVHNKEHLASCDVIFIAVPTPTTPDGFDDTILKSVIQLAPKGAIVVIKSTVLPGSTEKYQSMFEDLTIVYSPEFLCEATAAHDAANPFMNVIGVSRDTFINRSIAIGLLSILPKAPFEKVCHSTEAEFIKYTHNTLGYIKVVWVNMLHDALQAFGKDWRPVREAMEHDPMISGYYNDPIHKSGRGAGGSCFIKDFAALHGLYKRLAPNDELGHGVFDALEQKNLDLLLRSEKDLGLLRGVYGERIKALEDAAAAARAGAPPDTGALPHLPHLHPKGFAPIRDSLTPRNYDQ